MDFNFNSLSSQNFSSNAAQHLKPYGIYNVTLSKIEKTVLKGSKDPNATYPVVSLEFTGCGEDEGVFSTNLFIPSAQTDMERPTYQNSAGHDYQRPSRWENFQFTLMQIVHAINPTGEAKIKENASKLKSIDDFINVVIKALTGKSMVETKLKLVGRTNNGTVYANLPNACGLTKAGELFPVNFIGDNLFFTNYELSQQKAYQNAAPTNMDKVDNNPDEASSDELDLTDISFD